MGTWTADYDTLNRLVGIEEATPPIDPNSPKASFTNYCWSYDSFGNRTVNTASNSEFPSDANGNSLCPAQNHPSIGYNANNQAVQASGGPLVPTYDPSGDGDVVQDTNPQGTHSYLYDAEGRLCAVQYPGVNGGSPVMIGYVYDAEGRRVARGTITIWSCDPLSNGFTTTGRETDFVLDQFGNQVTEMTQVDGSMTWSHTNVWAGGQLLGTYGAVTDSNGQADGELHFYMTDWLGSRRVQVNYAGAWENDCVSLPFGDEESCSPAPTEHLFTGKERDSESGNDYFGARYYSSNMGRFLSPDKPLADQHKENPQSWNLYAYAKNNPLEIIDPNGEAAVIVVNGNNVTIYLPVSFSGNAATPANEGAYKTAITSAWTGQFGNYNTKIHIVPGDPTGPLTNDIHINAPTPADGAFPRPTTDVGGPNMNLFGLGDNAAQNDYEKWASGHETGHAMGEQNQYHDVNGQSVPNPGYENNIMGAVNGTPDARDINNIIAFPGNNVINITLSAPLNTETPTTNTLIQPIPLQHLHLQW